MPNRTDRNHSGYTLGTLHRPCYAAGEVLAARDLETEQRYRLQRIRRHNRYLHGWGVVCGLWVVPASDPRRPWAVQVCPGYAIDCCGDEILILESALVDVRDYLWRAPRRRRAAKAYIGIRTVEDPMRPVPTTPPGCGCDETIYRPARVRDGFRVDALWTLPETPKERAVDLCAGGPVPCPECPESRYVILACVSVPDGEGEPITSERIDNRAHRRRA
jgi:hypothetical protein